MNVRPKSPFQIVVLVEGEYEERVTVASIGSVYPLPYFALQNSLLGSVPNPQNGKESKTNGRQKTNRGKLYNENKQDKAEKTLREYAEWLAGFTLKSSSFVDVAATFNHNAELWDETARRFEHVVPLDLELLPADSMLREFYGSAVK